MLTSLRNDAQPSNRYPTVVTAVVLSNPAPTISSALHSEKTFVNTVALMLAAKDRLALSAGFTAPESLAVRGHQRVAAEQVFRYLLHAGILERGAKRGNKRTGREQRRGIFISEEQP